MERVLVGHVLTGVEAVEDPIVFKKVPATAIEAALTGRKVMAAGRKGKYWWLEMDSEPNLFGHLGMAGWVREVGAHSIRLREHGEAPFDDEAGRRWGRGFLDIDHAAQLAMVDEMARKSPDTNSPQKFFQRFRVVSI